ncbi:MULTISPECIES: hypothetical protein [unclassified Dehalobacter]|uniref:hypothetical protein n=1 Tax=unclassified Dehalobacter TaxID=2635733 RepID=UPI00104C2A9C|nr:MULTISPECIES: hypothetical protein [unclassified Dehalobacter]TCX51929.1 hypothetical protein C1I36_06320 [Dehalobacter sp. 14DCB1]TCX52989.1 hypothetical protein C1I38_08000 [Dehalobacter sp. 12DCB1]
MPKKEESAAEAIRVFPLAALRKECRRLYDISASTFDGATAGLRPDKEYTVEEVKNAIEKWQGRKV